MTKKPHLIKDNLSGEWTAILDIFRGFGHSPEEALKDLQEKIKSSQESPW